MSQSNSTGAFKQHNMAAPVLLQDYTHPISHWIQEIKRKGDLVVLCSRPPVLVARLLGSGMFALIVP